LFKKYVAPVIGSVKLTSVGPEQITNVLSRSKESGLNGTSRRRVHTVMKNMFKTAVQWRLLESNPIDGVDAPRAEDRQLVIPSAQ
jgi:site-specific recombinase XerC